MADFNWDDIKSPEDIINFGKKGMAKMKGKPYIPILIVGIIVVMIVYSGLFTIEADELGVVTRFGKYNRTVDSGLNFKIPMNVEKVYRVFKIQKVFTEEFGFRTAAAGIRSKFTREGFLHESLMLTGDLNAVEVSWIVVFNIKNAENFLFNLKESADFLVRHRRNMRIGHATVRDLSQAIMRQVIGDYSVNEVLTDKKEEIRLLVKTKLQESLDQYDAGILIAEVELKDVQAPGKVQDAFNEVNRAEQEKERMILEAETSYNKVIEEAKGIAAQKILESEGYYQERVNEAKGDVAAFLAMLKEYKGNKAITKKRLYLETMTRVLKKVEKKYIIDEDVRGVLPLLNIGERSAL